jgi:hypothetical protein
VFRTEHELTALVMDRGPTRYLAVSPCGVRTTIARAEKRGSLACTFLGNLQDAAANAMKQQSSCRCLARHRLNRRIGDVSLNQLFERRTAIITGTNERPRCGGSRQAHANDPLRKFNNTIGTA